MGEAPRVPAPALFYADWVHPVGDRFPEVFAYRGRVLARPIQCSGKTFLATMRAPCTLRQCRSRSLPKDALDEYPINIDAAHW